MAELGKKNWLKWGALDKYEVLSLLIIGCIYVNVYFMKKENKLIIK